MLTIDQLSTEFSNHLRLYDGPSDKRLIRAAETFLRALSETAPVSQQERRVRLLALVNSKFDVHKSQLDKLYYYCASKGLTFNYHEKARLTEAFDRADPQLFNAVVKARGFSTKDLTPFFTPSSADETIGKLHQELLSPTLVRKDSKPRNWAPEILQALFGGFVFLAYPLESAHHFFDTDAAIPYEADFWRHIHRGQGSFSRTKSLAYLRLSAAVGPDRICSAIRSEFETLANHGHLAIHLTGWGAQAWATAGYLTLYAEKFKEQPLSGAFFRWQDIEAKTRSYVPLKPHDEYGFNVANIGFHYKDTFVFSQEHVSDVVLIFQKNVADETVVICPACRSHDVHGNSYSSLGVKSWECRNPLCPDRSKFNRGKRYSFYQLLKQQAIEVEENRISIDSVRSWARDVQPAERVAGIVRMLVQHYSLAGDGVLLVNTSHAVPYGRVANYVGEDEYFASDRLGPGIAQFLDSTYFSRFCVETNPEPASPRRRAKQNEVVLLNGNSTNLLAAFSSNSVAGAVTSPPYYNAREYSQWDNIYCYLFDMFQNARMVFRVLQPGGYYLFNIFDYFDNENTIAFSAMGQKRMILSAYCIDMFERANFRCVGNIVWDKGDIEGKRAFNGGNFSPYYQAPFNCWEHILVFRKPGDEVQLSSPLPEILRSKPVFKMVRGENRHGHTAPFPEALPRLLLDRLPRNATVLDPFAGSMTTGVAASRTGHNAICIELDEQYFELGHSMVRAASVQADLFE